MNNVKQNILMVGFCILVAVTTRGQDLVAAFKIPKSPRRYLFNFHSPTWGAGSTNAVPRGIEGLQTALAKRFTVTQSQGVVTVTLFDALMCRAHRAKGEESGSSVMSFGELNIGYPAGTSVLVLGNSMRLADLTEKTFDPPTTFNETHTGEEAIKKLKEMGLEPPEDMDPAWNDPVKK